MEMAFQKTQLPCMIGAVREIQNSEQTQELRLPDGMPDVGKVLCAWGQVILRGKEWRSDSILVSGGMLMWVLYQPEDGSEPRTLDGWLPFQMRWQLPEGCPEGRIRVSALTRFADARSVSPRKLMLRAGIGVLAEAWAPHKLELCTPTDLPEGVELLRRRYPVRLPQEAGEKVFSMEEELNPGVRPKQMLYYTLRPEIQEQKVLSNKIAFRGNAGLHAVWLCEDGTVMSQDFAMPFSQFAELDNAGSSDAQVDVACCVTNLEVETEDAGTLRVKCSIAAQYLCDDVTTLETVEDAYAPGRALRVEQQMLEVPAILEKKTETVFGEASAAMEGMQASDVSFLPDFPRQYHENGGLTLEIPGTVQVLSSGEDGKLTSASARWEGKLDWKAGENTVLTAVPMTPPMPQAMTNGSNLTVRAELPLQMVTTGGQGIPMVTELELGADTEPDPARPSLILRRAGTDSLWEIAKKSGSTVAAIRSANHLQEEPRPGQMLLIPVC